MVVSSIINRTGGVLKAAGSIASGSIQTAVELGASAKDTVVGIGSAAVDAGVSARDAVSDAADTVVAYATAAASIGVMTVKVLAVVGVAVSFVVAPVPTAIGVTLIELLAVAAAARLSQTEDELQAQRLARENGRLIDKLAKYGTVPATALVETEAASLRLDTVAGTITGHVKTGIFSSRDIGEMSEDELRTFASGADAETARLIEAYLAFRMTSAA